MLLGFFSYFCIINNEKERNNNLNYHENNQKNDSHVAMYDVLSLDWSNTSGA